MNQTKYLIDWSSIIVDIVKKKDLDGGDWANCWDEDYDWTELDLYVCNNYFDELLDWASTRYKLGEYGFIEHDLREYIRHLEE